MKRKVRSSLYLFFVDTARAVSKKIIKNKNKTKKWARVHQRTKEKRNGARVHHNLVPRVLFFPSPGAREFRNRGISKPSWSYWVKTVLSADLYGFFSHDNNVRYSPLPFIFSFRRYNGPGKKMMTLIPQPITAVIAQVRYSG